MTVQFSHHHLLKTLSLIHCIFFYCKLTGQIYVAFFLGYLFLSIDQCDCFYVNIKQFLEREMGAHSSTLAWEIPWTEEPGGLQSRGCTESDTNEGT